MEELVEERREAIYNAFKIAEAEARLEDRQYALIDEIFHTVSTFVSPKRVEKSWSIHPQPLLVPHEHRGSETDQFVNTVPDTGLFLTNAAKKEIDVIALTEEKRLYYWEVKDGKLVQPGWSNEPKPGQKTKKSKKSRKRSKSGGFDFPIEFDSPWSSLNGIDRHRGLLYNNLPQLIQQGFFALHAFPRERKIHLIFHSGVWFTVLCFNRPDDLNPIPKTLPAKNSTDRSRALIELLPEDVGPEVVVYNEPLLACVRTKKGLDFQQPLSLSYAFSKSLRLMIPDMDKMGIRSYSIFSTGLKQDDPNPSVEAQLKDQVELGEKVIASWYANVRKYPSPPPQNDNPYVESPQKDKDGNELESPNPTPYKGPLPAPRQRDDYNTRSGPSNHPAPPGGEDDVLPNLNDINTEVPPRKRKRTRTDGSS